MFSIKCALCNFYMKTCCEIFPCQPTGKGFQGAYFFGHIYARGGVLERRASKKKGVLSRSANYREGGGHGIKKHGLLLDQSDSIYHEIYHSKHRLRRRLNARTSVAITT